MPTAGSDWFQSMHFTSDGCDRTINFLYVLWYLRIITVEARRAAVRHI